MSNRAKKIIAAYEAAYKAANNNTCTVEPSKRCKTKYVIKRNGDQYSYSDYYLSDLEEMTAELNKRAEQSKKEIEEETNRKNEDGLTDAEQQALGENIATLLKLKPSRDHKDRFDTSVGTYTARGIYNLMHRVITSKQAIPI